MKTLFILTEEESLRIALDVILPKLIDPSRVSYQVIAHDGKQDLETAIRRTVPSLSRIPGARIIVTLLAALEKRGQRRGIAALCIGGGEATAVAIERMT